MLKTFLFLLLMAFVHAKWEVQIEGKDGWAAKLPCWRLNVFFRKLLGEKPLTGYHLWMMILFQTIFHGIYMFRVWSVGSEISLQGFFMLYFIMEDILWFIVNPHYTWKKFIKRDISWHKRWCGPVPSSYMVMGILGILLIILGRVYG
jgi:hypothetical protein